MSRPSRSERLAAKGRPKRRAAKTHFFKYQLANNPSRAEENDLKRALQESLEEQSGFKKSCNNNAIISSTNSSDVSRSNNSSYSNESAGSFVINAMAQKRTRSSAPTSTNATPPSKKAKLNVTLNGQSNSTPKTPTATKPPSPAPRINRAIKTYSRVKPKPDSPQQQQQPIVAPITPKTSTYLILVPQTTSTPSLLQDRDAQPRGSSQSSVSRSTQTPSVSSSKSSLTSTPKNVASDSVGKIPEPTVPLPVKDQYLQFKRESKNYAYVKMTALKVSTSKSPSGNSKSTNSKKSSPNGISHNISSNKNSSNSKASPKVNISQNGVGYNSTLGQKLGKTSIPMNDILIDVDNEVTNNDCSIEDDDETIDLSKKKNHNQADVKVTKKRLSLGSWSLLGVPEEKIIYLRDDEPPRRLICYPAIKHVEGDVIQVRDSVLLRSGARKTDLPYIAKVCAFWEDAETGGVMMSLFWYYRPEHTEDGRRPHHLPDEIFASRHRDVDSVECIEDKCYVLTFNEYCRYKKRCKMEQVNTTWSLADVTIPVSNESYPRRNRIPESDVNPELVFCCRQIYDSRMKRLIKNPHINTKYGHI